MFCERATDTHHINKVHKVLLEMLEFFCLANNKQIHEYVLFRKRNIHPGIGHAEIHNVKEAVMSRKRTHPVTETTLTA